jgi:hypothetical protein
MVQMHDGAKSIITIVVGNSTTIFGQAVSRRAIGPWRRDELVWPQKGTRGTTNLATEGHGGNTDFYRPRKTVGWNRLNTVAAVRRQHSRRTSNTVSSPELLTLAAAYGLITLRSSVKICACGVESDCLYHRLVLLDPCLFSVSSVAMLRAIAAFRFC